MTDFFEIKSIFLKSYFLFFRILTYQEKMDPLETLLHKAVKAGNIQDVKALILNGVDINATEKFNRTPLYLAVLQNKVPIVNILLQNGADPDVADSVQRTPLHGAAAFDYIEIVKMLIAKDAKIRVETSLGSARNRTAVRAILAKF